LNFPDDVLDCQAGRLAVAKEKIHLEEKYQKRPHNRRTLYQSKLHIDHPFSFEWQTILPSTSNGKNSPHSSLYVLRNRRQLDLLDKWMRGKQTKPEEIFQLHGASALVPINVECLSRGVPRRFALIVLPTLVDLENYRTANQKGEKFILTENEEKTDSDTEDRETEMEVDQNSPELGNFVSLDNRHPEPVVSLNSLFPDEAAEKTQKRRLKKRADRKKMKIRRRQSTGVVEAIEEKEEKSAEPSCSRQIIGRIVRGDFSFSSSSGRATGYCSLDCLQSVFNRTVLFRNNSSKYYHPAKISLLLTLPDL